MMSTDTSQSLAAASPNFNFLEGYDARLIQVVLSVERYLFEDPVVTLMRLRQFGELLAQEAATMVGIYTHLEEGQADLLRRLSDRGVLNREVAGIFHDLRCKDNAAAHGSAGDQREALYQLRMARTLAIAEWPTSSGPAGYMLFTGHTPMAVVEAKRKRKDVVGAIEQAKRYSRDYVIKADETLARGPWGEYKVPFLFATSGRPFLRQLRTKSGICFLDARRSTNYPDALDGWYTLVPCQASKIG